MSPSAFVRLMTLETEVFVLLQGMPGLKTITIPALARMAWENRLTANWGKYRSLFRAEKDEEYDQLEQDLKLYFSIASGQFQTEPKMRIRVLHRDGMDPTPASPETSVYAMFFETTAIPETCDVLDTLAVACDAAEERNDRPAFYQGLRRIMIAEIIGDSPMGLEQSAAASREAIRRAAIASPPVQPSYYPYEEENTTSWE